MTSHDLPRPSTTFHDLPKWLLSSLVFSSSLRVSQTLLIRHPLLVGTNLASTCCVALVCAWAFWSVNYELSGGVLQRMGLLFFLGAHFLLTGLANIGVWKQERQLYFHERGVGCYGTVPFVLSKTLLADVRPPLP